MTSLMLKDLSDQIFPFSKLLGISPVASEGYLAKIPPNQFIVDFSKGSSVESESE